MSCWDTSACLEQTLQIVGIVRFFPRMKMMTATHIRQNFGEFLECVIQEPVVIKRQKREMGVVLPISLYRKLIAQNNRAIGGALDDLQAGVNGLTQKTLDKLLAEGV